MRQTKFQSQNIQADMQEINTENIEPESEGEWKKRKHLLFIAQCHNLRMFIT